MHPLINVQCSANVVTEPAAHAGSCSSSATVHSSQSSSAGYGTPPRKHCSAASCVCASCSTLMWHMLPCIKLADNSRSFGCSAAKCVMYRSFTDGEEGDRDQQVSAGHNGRRSSRLPVLAAQPGHTGAQQQPAANAHMYASVRKTWAHRCAQSRLSMQQQGQGDGLTGSHELFVARIERQR